jgi:hypothetical protein
MATFAVLDHENNVSNVIVAETREVAEDVTGKTCVPCESTYFFGWHWNGTEFIKPEPVVIETPAE